MGPTNGRNLEKVKYFSIQQYLKNIEFEMQTLDHMEVVNRAFDEYIEKLMKYDELAITLFLCKSFEEEMKYSNQIENHIITPLEINEHNMFFDKLSINHVRIKQLHQFALKEDDMTEYRTTEMKIGTYRKLNPEIQQEGKIIEKDGERYYEDIYWYGAESEDIRKFMDDLITFYKDNSFSVVNSNPFIKSSLVHLLFLRIHPFEDGNGRTARLLHNMKFTDSINRMKGSRLKISPLNISPGISNFKNDYNKCIDNIFFDLDHFERRNNNNPEINRFINFMLNTIEEEITFLEKQLRENEESMYNISNMPSYLFEDEIKRMKLRALAPKKY